MLLVVILCIEPSRADKLKAKLCRRIDPAVKPPVLLRKGRPAMNGKRQELLDRMVLRIVEEVAPEQIVLFGSWAKGEERADSDLDLLVVERDDFGPARSRRAEMTRVWGALSGFGVPVDVLMFSREEIERHRGAINHVVARAFREGRVLYDRG